MKLININKYFKQASVMICLLFALLLVSETVIASEFPTKNLDKSTYVTSGADTFQSKKPLKDNIKFFRLAVVNEWKSFTVYKSGGDYVIDIIPKKGRVRIYINNNNYIKRLTLDADNKKFDFNDKTSESSSQMLAALFNFGFAFESLNSKAKKASEDASRENILSRKELLPTIASITFKDTAQEVVEKLEKIPGANVFTSSSTINASGFIFKGVESYIRVYFEKVDLKVNKRGRSVEEDFEDNDQVIKMRDGKIERFSGAFIRSVSFHTVDPETPSVEETNELFKFFKDKCSGVVMDKPDSFHGGSKQTCHDYMSNELAIEKPHDGPPRWGQFKVWFKKSEKMMDEEKAQIEGELRQKQREENADKPTADSSL